MKTPGSHWEHTFAELDWLPGGALNAAHEAIDRHAVGPRKDRLALVWQGVNGEREEYTFAQMKALSDRFANVLKSLGVEVGDRVLTYIDRVPEHHIALLGALKIGAIAGALLPTLGPDPVKERMKDCAAKVLVTHPHLRRGMSDAVYELFELQHIVVVNKSGRDPWPADSVDLDYYEEMDKAPDGFPIVTTSPDDYATIHYTPGTPSASSGQAAGSPLGALITHRATAQHYTTGRDVLDLRGDDIYWCTVDLGCATGTSSGLLAPWTNGATQLVYEAPFRATAWYEQLQGHRVTVWCTSPTAIRLLMRAGDELPTRYDLSSLRRIVTVGGPLDTEATTWVSGVLKVPASPTWSQAETGAVLIAGGPATDSPPGSIGASVPGVEAAVLDGDFEPAAPDTIGALAVRSGWPSMFAAYWGDLEAHDARFVNGWYVTGDLARVDEDGHFWPEGRSGEHIVTAGHPVSPAEVERALVQHPAVAAARVAARPHPIAGQVVVATVALTDDYEPTPELRRDIMRFARHRLGTALAPRRIELAASLHRD